MKLNKCKIYLEGIEIPFNSIQITQTISAPSRTEVVLPINDNLFYILPKTQIHVFYSDSGDKPFYLIFEGYLTDIKFSRSGIARNASASFVSFTNELKYTATRDRNVDIDNALLKNSILTVGISPIDASGKYIRSSVKYKDIYSSSVSPATATATGVIDSFLTLVGKKDLSIVESISHLLNLTAEINAYYGLLNKTLKLSDRFKVLENELDSKLYDSISYIESISHSLKNHGGLISIFEVLNFILSVFNYNWVDLSTPLYLNEKPTSFIIKPNMSYMLPIINNIFMPYDISDLSYSRDMENEATRTIINSPPVVIRKNDVESELMNLTYVSPFTALTKDDNNKVIAGPTPEEKYRGFNPRIGEYSGGAERVLAHIAKNTRTGGKETIPLTGDEVTLPNQNDLDNINKEELTHFSLYADKAFFDQRYSGRSCSLTTIYSPYRMIGFPALIIDKILPAVYGVIQTITSSISSDGQAIQHVKISAPKLLGHISGTTPNDGEIRLNYIPYFGGTFGHDYDADTIGKEIYSEFSNLPDGSILSLLTDSEKDTTITPILLRVVKKLVGNLQNNEKATRRSLSLAIQSQKLVEEGDFWKFFGDGVYEANKLSYLSSREFGDEHKNRPFVKERQDRVKLAMLAKSRVYHV